MLYAPQQRRPHQAAVLWVVCCAREINDEHFYFVLTPLNNTHSLVTHRAYEAYVAQVCARVEVNTLREQIFNCNDSSAFSLRFARSGRRLR